MSQRRRRSRSKSRRRTPTDGPKEKAPVPQSLGFGKKGKHKQGPLAAQKLPTVPVFPQNKLKLLKVNRIKDYVTMEEEYLNSTKGTSTTSLARCGAKKQDIKLVEKLRGAPMQVATLEDIVDEQHAIVSLAGGALPFYVPIMSFVDREKLQPNARVLLGKRSAAIVGVLDDNFGMLATKMRLEKAPSETFADIGGLEEQIQELREVIELPLSKPELFEEMGITPQKGVILYGPPGTGKTMLAKAVANSTAATFLRVAGSELVKKTAGAGPKLVREIFKIAEENAPTIIFIDEIDAVGSKRDTSGKASDGEKEVQRTMLELLNQLDGFEQKKDVRIIMATNRIDSLDPALIRPGRIDRKIEVPLPGDQGRKRIFDLATRGMTLNSDVEFDKLEKDDKDSLSGADIKAIVSAAGIVALRDRRSCVTQADMLEAKRQVLYRKKENIPASLYI